jgi:Carboxypeptidase regulatory-like domain
MSNKSKSFLLLITLMFSLSVVLSAQSITANISGQVLDEQQKAIPNAVVKARNVATNTTRSLTSDGEGRYRFPNLPTGTYEVTVEANGFAKLVRTGITLQVNQDAVIDATMKVSTVTEVVTITENASILNTTNSEVSTRYDEKRLSELPIATNRNVFNVVLSAPGVSQLGSGQTGFANGVSFSANGGRVRSNNFIIDGQDSNDPSVAGGQQAMNNPDLVQELRLITNQFAPEFGRNSGSVVSVVTKSGTNQYHGSAFWFHNDNHQNACSNTDKAGRPGGFCNPNGTGSRKGAPFRLENQVGGTFGGPLFFPRFGEGGPSVYDGRDKTWFFGSVQRWTDRQLGSGSTLNGAPTEAGRQILQQAAGSRPQVAALLRFLPAAQTPTGQSAAFTLNGQNYTVPLGSLTGAASFKFDDWQWSTRFDHQFNENNRFSARYLYDSNQTTGTGQVTPPGLTTANTTRTQSLAFSLNSVLSQRLVNEVRLAYQRYGSNTSSSDPSSETIPSLEISELGLTGFNAANSRTAIGLAVNLPQFRFNNTYQLMDTMSYTAGNHNMKFGVDIQKREVKSFFFPTIRGLLRYATLQRFVSDVADAANINKPLAGGSEIQYYNFWDNYFFWQDEWKVRPNFTLTYGLRYELPNNSVANLVPFNDKIVAAAGNDDRFRFTPVPNRDRNNWQPRLGFNWRINGLGFLSGQDKLVLRGGYARTNDASFININLNIASAFPFVAAVSLPTVAQTTGGPGVNNAFTALPAAQPAGLNPLKLTRTIVGGDFRAPAYDQFSLELQRELGSDIVFKVGYVGTKGAGLFQTLDGNPQRIGCVKPATEPNPDFCRADPTRGVIRLRANAASSIYHSLQVSTDKRLSKNFSAGIHYTWSAFIDTASEIFNPSSGEVAVAQDSFNIRSDRGRSAYDRPHRLTGNFVYELPIYRAQEGFVGRLLGGWQINSFFTLQSGAPFTPLNGADPAGALSGIDSLVGSAIRPNLNTTQNVSGLNIIELLAAGGRTLFQPITAAQRVGNAGRNILRADGIGDLGLGFLKNIRVREGNQLQFRADMFNATNTRNFGIPEGRVNSTNFLNQWGTNGGNRRIILGLRYTF